MNHIWESDLLGIDDDGSILRPTVDLRDTTNENHAHPFDAESSTEVSGEYLSFSSLAPKGKSQITFTKSEDESSIRATSHFDYPESTVGNEGNENIHDALDNREVKTTSRIESSLYELNGTFT